MTGTGRRRKPNPDEEGQPQPPSSQGSYQGAGPGAGATADPGAYRDSGTYGGGDSSAGNVTPRSYSYDWRQSSTPGQTPQPGPVFDGYSSSGANSASSTSASSNSNSMSGVYNPVGFDLQDPYSPSAYGGPAAPPPPPPPAPAQPGPMRFPRPTQAPEPTGLFDDSDLFGDDAAGSVAAPSATASAPTSSPEAPSSAGDDGAPRPKDGYTAADFAFLDEETGQDVNGWLNFAETRAESRADRTRRFRQRIIGAGVAVAVVGAAVGGYLLFNGGPLGSSAPAKSVILFQISDSTGDAVGDALLVTDRSATPTPTSTGAKASGGAGAAVLIPSQMLVNTIGFGAQPFGGQMAQSIPAAGKDTVADALGVSIDGVWRMDETTLAALIDEIGGIQLTTDTDVPAATSTAAPTAPAVAKGAGKLTGAQAISYATYLAPGDPVTAQIQRFGQVVSALLGVLPPDATSITADLGRIGIIDDPSLPESKLTPILAALAAEQQAGAYTSQVLPLRTDGSMELDYTAAAPIVTKLLGGALKAGAAAGQLSRVLVEDASGHTVDQSSYVRAAAQAKLSNAGYTYIDGASVAKRTTSVVEVPSAGQHDAAVQIAQTLGLPANDVQVVPGMSTIADVTVLLGSDWPALAGVTVPPPGTARTSPSASASAAGRK